MDLLNGFNVVLMGPTGTGKTHAIGTLVENTPLDVFYFPLESGAESLVGYFTDRGMVVPPNLHLHELTQPQAGFMDIFEAAKKTNTLPHDAVMKMTDARRSKYDGYLKLLEALNAPVDQNGEKFEPADKWGTDRVIVIDGLTGLNEFAMQLVIGGKAERTQTDWGVAQSYIMSLINKLTSGCKCHFVLIAHVDREVDAIQGGVKLMMSTLGKAINGILPTKFSDVVICRKEVDKFYWSTAASNADVKNRNLPLSDKIAPDFGPLYEKWLSRSKGGV